VQDLDVDVRLALAKGSHRALMRQIELDTALLARMNVMDYSLLLGVHYPKWGDATWHPPHQRQAVCARKNASKNLPESMSLLCFPEDLCSLTSTSPRGRDSKQHLLGGGTGQEGGKAAAGGAG
jgi:hypothetical protein